MLCIPPVGMTTRSLVISGGAVTFVISSTQSPLSFQARSSLCHFEHAAPFVISSAQPPLSFRARSPLCHFEHAAPFVISSTQLPLSFRARSPLCHFERAAPFVISSAQPPLSFRAHSASLRASSAEKSGRHAISILQGISSSQSKATIMQAATSNSKGNKSRFSGFIPGFHKTFSFFGLFY